MKPWNLKGNGQLKIFSAGSALKESVPFWEKNRPNGQLSGHASLDIGWESRYKKINIFVYYIET